jgi:hypothetical protein
MRIILGIFLASFVVTAAHAQTAEEIAACRPDALRLCKPQTEGLFSTIRTLNCMMAHRPQLSTKCNAVLIAHGL